MSDYAVTGVTTEPHLLAELRVGLAEKGILSLAEMLALSDGDRVEVAGAVIVRQRPESAGGVCFLTLEDETGLANAFLNPKIFERFRRVLQRYPLLLLRGRLQKQEGVTHLRVESIRPVGEEENLPPARNFH